MSLSKKSFVFVFALVLLFGGLASVAEAQSLGGQTYQQSTFGNTPTYGGNPPASSRGGTSVGSSTSCDNLGNRGFSGVVGCLVGLMNTAIYLMISGAVLFVVYGAFLMTASEEKRENGRHIIYNGLIGLFVMISIWGLVNILNKTFNLSSVSGRDVIPRGGFITPP